MFRNEKQNQLKKQKKLSTEESPSELTFIEHVYELRKRLFWVVLVLMIASAISFQLKDQMIGAVMAPLHGQKLIYLTPGGGFSFIFTLSLYFGILFSIPFIVYHMYRFLQPLLGKSSRLFVAVFMLMSTVLAAGGALFGYYVTIPAALNFLSTFAGDSVIPSLTAESYLNFVVTYVVGLAVLFQLPLLLFIFDHISPFKPGTLSGTQNKVIIGATVLSALITPTPDAINMAIVAIPIVIVYQIGVLAIFIRRKYGRRTRRVVAAKKQTAPEIHDEPLTAIFEELSLQPVLEPVPVPVPVQGPMSQPGPSVNDFVKLQPQLQLRPRPSKAIDGFAPRPRPGTSPLSVPARPAPIAQRPMPHPTPVNRQVRSIDGFRLSNETA